MTGCSLCDAGYPKRPHPTKPGLWHVVPTIYGLNPDGSFDQRDGLTCCYADPEIEAWAARRDGWIASIGFFLKHWRWP